MIARAVPILGSRAFVGWPMTHSERGYPVLVPAGRKIFETLHALAAGVWLGALVMGGATAGILFTTMRRLDPTFGVFDTYTGDMSNIGAGFIQNRVFLAMDFVQYGAATLVLISTIALITVLRMPIRRASSVVRLLALGAAMTLVSFHLFVLTPRMQMNAQAYWEAADVGENERAAEALAAFDADHPTARRVLVGLTGTVFVLLLSGVWSGVSASELAPVAKRTKRDHREQPALLKKGGGR
tara:strand:- start:1697 stop:2419 length:723 start_codon:yes stop_codon:yes gene_type:complete